MEIQEEVPGSAFTELNLGYLTEVQMEMSWIYWFHVQRSIHFRVLSISGELKANQNQEPKREACVENTSVGACWRIRSLWMRQSNSNREAQGEAGERDIMDTQDIQHFEKDWSPAPDATDSGERDSGCSLVSQKRGQWKCHWVWKPDFSDSRDGCGGGSRAKRNTAL